jgi:CDP-diacylglycerol--serine O-phosphatidyltransferase
MSEVEDVPQRRRRGIYLLPNLFTTATLFGGFYAIVAAMNGDFSKAAIAIGAAMVADSLDGMVARMTHTASDFGKEYDSLCDMVAFGVAPAIVVYQWGIERIADYGKFWGRFGWLAAFFYAVAAALRLARFNARAASADKRYFEGLPSPSAAAAVASFVWLASELDLTAAQQLTAGLPSLVFAFAITICIGALMVSRFSYWSGKELNVRGRIPWVYAALIPLVYVIISLAPASLFALFGVYAASAPLFWLWRKIVRKKRIAESG